MSSSLTEPVIFAPGTIPPAGVPSIEAEVGMTITYGPGAGTVYLGPPTTSTLAAGAGAGVLGDALTSLTMIEALYEGIEILSALPNEQYGVSGVVTDTIQVTFRIIGRPGPITVTVPYSINWQAIAFFQIGLKAQTVELIYEGASDNQQVPTVLLVPPPSGEVTLIPQPGTTTLV